MKPLRLTVSAIGPFAEQTDVDFDSLSDDGLFLIHGPTGSGKTFLLDAMTFALYGAVSSERAVTGLRSDHAVTGTDTFVELEFLAQGGRWKVHRTPQHERAKKRGTGTTTEPSRVVLFRHDGQDWVAVANRSAEVADQVRDLVGLSHRQFTQVILLPQGKFEAVLRADSADRETLLKSLFDTELYERVSDHLERSARRAEAECATHDDELERLRRQAWDRWTEIRSLASLDDPDDGGRNGELLAGPLLDEQPANQVQMDLLADEASEATKVATRRAADAAARLTSATADHAAVVSLVERIERRAELRAVAARLSSAAPDVERDRQRLVRAEQAAALRPALADGHAAQAALAEAAEHAAGAARAAERARTAVAVALPDAVRTLDLGRAAERGRAVDAARSALAVTVAEMSQLEAVDRRRGELTLEVRSAEATAVEQADAAARQRAVAAAADALIGPARAQLDEASAATAALPGLKAVAAGAATALDAARGLGQARRQLAQAAEVHETARSGANRAHERWNDARALYLDGIAAVLAAQLQPGEDCPVCGSDEHPHPAAAASGAVTLEQVDRAEAEAQLAAQERDRLGALRHDAEQQVERLHERAGVYADDVAGAAAACEAAAQQVQVAQAAVTAGPEAAAALEAALQAQTRATTDAEQAELAAAAARARATTLRTELERCTVQLTERLGDDLTLTQVLDSLRELDAALSAVASADTSVAVAGEHAARSAARLADELAAAAFDSVAAAAEAMLADDELRSVQARVRRYDERHAEVTTLLAAPELAELPEHAPDTTPSAQRLELATRDDAAARRRVVRLGDGADQIVSWTDEHRAVLQRSDEVRRHAARLRRLSDTAGGRSGAKLSLQRWVLATYLEEICSLATVRLRTMTAGRYSLHVHRAQVRGGARSGLDLRVLDAFTGEQRDVSSLSGGETFQASLALALAVADAVEQHTGGVRLDALFVDEGFGTLDPDALELAMDELDQLRAGGRMVGVISHVGGLKERVRTGIELTPSARGSSVRVGQISGG
jgi:exonuclease SbcC